MDFKTEKHLDRGKEFSKHGSEQLKPETKEADEQDWDNSWAFGNPNSFNDIAVFGSGTSKGQGKVKGAGKHGKKGGKGGKAVEEDHHLSRFPGAAGDPAVEARRLHQVQPRGLGEAGWVQESFWLLTAQALA
eukprot:Skav222161  [mRNA]  locus=scaffold3048:46029:46424:- [translate_table: standard]